MIRRIFTATYFEPKSQSLHFASSSHNSVNFRKVKSDPVRIQKDRSLDIYNETVRQRASRQNAGVDLFHSKEVFAKDSFNEHEKIPTEAAPPKVVSSPKPSVQSEVVPKNQVVKKRKAPQPQHRLDSLS